MYFMRYSVTKKWVQKNGATDELEIQYEITIAKEITEFTMIHEANGIKLTPSFTSEDTVILFSL